VRKFRTPFSFLLDRLHQGLGRLDASSEVGGQKLANLFPADLPQIFQLQAKHLRFLDICWKCKYSTKQRLKPAFLRCCANWGLAQQVSPCSNHFLMGRTV
jgi:hypothetical protein